MDSNYDYDYDQDYDSVIESKENLDDSSYSREYYVETNVVASTRPITRFNSMDEDNVDKHTYFTSSSDAFQQIFNLNILSSPKDVETNFTLESFDNIKHLCNGSHSAVFTANHKNLKTKYDQKVVLKILLENSTQNDVANAEFQNEIATLVNMNHPNILQILGYGMLNSINHGRMPRPMIVVETLAGDTLAYHLSLKRHWNSRPFTEKRYLRMAKEFSSALMYIHDQIHPNCSLVHRDLKPDNIGFMEDGTLKLMDFGLAVCIKKDASDISGAYKLTGCTGSLRYMAPEVALNQPYNEKVDIYGFGLIMYQIITGVTPFLAFKSNQYYSEVVHNKYRPSLEYDDNGRQIRMNEDLRNLIRQCWNDNHAHRPSATSIHAAIEGIETGKRNDSIVVKGINMLTAILSLRDSI